MQVIIGILLFITALVLIVTVLLQESKQNGIGAVSGAAETFFGKNKAKGLEAKLALITKICAIAFVVLAIINLFLN
ncbi:MAG: preprotein translocase subunit SecG [Clostridia bacterium]|nr:preprotein translocase subunit SecG [Clostridia bacterium]MBP3651181.1 preprotein translocase subunit SecG [Clostridia bacterium]